jgi:hypothetical protein
MIRIHMAASERPMKTSWSRDVSEEPEIGDVETTRLFDRVDRVSWLDPCAGWKNPKVL